VPWTSDNPFAEPGERVASRAAKPRVNSQAKGKRAERMLAAWWRDNGFPDASRYVKTGDRFAADGGDLVLEHGEFRLVVEVKHHAGGLTDGQIAEYGEKLITKQVPQSKGTMGILVERRDRVSDAGRWWVHIDPYAFALLCTGYPDFVADPPIRCSPLACRTTVDYFAHLLRSAGLAQVPP
jgi:hypothetical protein